MASNAVGRLIEDARKRVSPPLTQIELAALAGTTQATISNLETGRSDRLEPELANRLARVLPITMHEIVSALGYDLPSVARVGIPPDILQGLSGASPELLDSVRLLIAGQRAVWAAQARTDRERNRQTE